MKFFKIFKRSSSVLFLSKKSSVQLKHGHQLLFQTQGRESIAAKLVANLITEAGANRVLACDLHSGQSMGYFDIPVDHVYGQVIDYCTWFFHQCIIVLKNKTTCDLFNPNEHAMNMLYICNNLQSVNVYYFIVLMHRNSEQKGQCYSDMPILLFI